ncbi:hypothetical protein RIEPE_A0003 (plasmid) [Candidatus Riesia pediculicola USDA]|uniref:Uncharacterized protein n=1 Tax=Riesia pediculicola (strain USDA) TaxID=515618 RepID=D4G921_RIEPU|nr:hypothetical protein RIEPE_A0003 [Candidatus Riesia pediculicola USDA]
MGISEKGRYTISFFLTVYTNKKIDFSNKSPKVRKIKDKTHSTKK